MDSDEKINEEKKSDENNINEEKKENDINQINENEIKKGINDEKRNETETYNANYINTKSDFNFNLTTSIEEFENKIQELKEKINQNRTGNLKITIIQLIQVLVNIKIELKLYILIKNIILIKIIIIVIIIFIII